MQGALELMHRRRAATPSPSPSASGGAVSAKDRKDWPCARRACGCLARVLLPLSMLVIVALGRALNDLHRQHDAQGEVVNDFHREVAELKRERWEQQQTIEKLDREKAELAQNPIKSESEASSESRELAKPHTVKEAQMRIGQALIDLWDIQAKSSSEELIVKGMSTPRYILNAFNTQVSQQLYQHLRPSRDTSGGGGTDYTCLDWDFRYVKQYKQCTKLINYKYATKKIYNPPSPGRNGLIQGDFGGDLTHVPDELIDLLVCTQVFEHVPHFWNAFPNLARIVKDEGILIFTVPFMFRFHPFPGDFYRYSPQAILHLLESNGFAMCQMTSDGWKSSQMVTMVLGLGDLPEAEKYLNSQSKESLIAGASNYQVLAQRVKDVEKGCSLPKFDLMNEITKEDLLQYTKGWNMPAMEHFPIGK